jgi:IMP dehydrogenase
MVRKVSGLCGAAIGVAGDFEERSTALYDAGARVLCLDVAHGHHVLVERALKTLKDIYGNDVHLMAGNVATLGGFNDLADWGADSIRCGIGGGSICTTRIQTGHGVPGFETILECAQSDRDAKIIIDGGIKNSGDIVKALAAGADFVMLGSLLAGTTESPGEVVTYTDGSKRKAYRGMASKKAQEAWRGKSSTPEGIATTVHYKGSVKNIIKDLVGGIKSGCSYSGAKNLKELRAHCHFIRQSAASKYESSPHILVKE